MAKTHTLIIRGLSKAQKNSLKRQAKSKDKRASVNSYMLQAIHDITTMDIAAYESNKSSKK